MGWHATWWVWRWTNWKTQLVSALFAQSTHNWKAKRLLLSFSHWLRSYVRRKLEVVSRCNWYVRVFGGCGCIYCESNKGEAISPTTAHFQWKVVVVVTGRAATKRMATFNEACSTVIIFIIFSDAQGEEEQQQPSEEPIQLKTKGWKTNNQTDWRSRKIQEKEKGSTTNLIQSYPIPVPPSFNTTLTPDWRWKDEKKPTTAAKLGCHPRLKNERESVYVCVNGSKSQKNKKRNQKWKLCSHLVFNKEAVYSPALQSTPPFFFGVCAHALNRGKWIKGREAYVFLVFSPFFNNQ